MEAMDEYGTPVVFATRTPQAIPQDSPVTAHVLPPQSPFAGDILELAALAESIGAAGIVFDHYQVDSWFIEELRKVSPRELKLVAIGNTAPLSNALNLAIRQTIRTESRHHRKELRGPEYLLMRKMFRNRPEREIAPVVRRVLVTLGGSRTGSLPLILKALNRPFGHGPLEVFIAGPKLEHCRLPGTVHQFIPLGLVQDMVGLLESVDFAITACGTTLYQMAACGLPAIGIAVADNQVQQAFDFAEAGLIHFLGPLDTVKETDIVEAVSKMIGNPEERRAMSISGQRLVDGCGALRCAEALLSPMALHG